MCRAGSRILLAFCIATIGCGGGEAGKKEPEVTAHKGALIEENQQVEEADDDLQAGIEESLSIWAPGEIPMAIDPARDLLGFVQSRVRPRFTDPACVMASLPGTPGTIQYQLTNCETRSGVTGITGAVTSTWTRMGADILVHALRGTDVRVGGSRQTLDVTVTFSRTDTTLARTRQGSWSGTLASGKTFSVTGSRSQSYVLAEQCETRDGTVNVVFGGDLTFTSTQVAVKRCGRVLKVRLCPISGKVVLTQGSMAPVTITFDGTAVGKVEGAGAQTSFMLRCTGATTDAGAPLDAADGAASADAAADAGAPPDTAADAPAASDGGPYQPTTTYEFRTLDGHSVNDTARNRTIPIALRVPNGVAGPLPLILLSHGGGLQPMGRDPKSVLPEWSRVFASAGYAVITMLHGEDMFFAHCAPLSIPAGECEPGDMRLEVSEGGTLQVGFYDRPLDASAVLDGLAGIEAWAGITFDRTRIGVAGHSAGSTTPMALAGKVLDVSPSVHAFQAPDPRFRAFLALSPQGIGRAGSTATSWDTVSGPMMVATGAADRTEREQPRDRRDPFMHMRGPDKFELYVDSPRATHEAFALGAYPGLETPQQYIASSGVAFFDAYLRGSASARGWLDGNGVSAWSGGLATMSVKRDGGGSPDAGGATDAGSPTDGGAPVPLIDRALEGHCPGGRPADNGVAPGRDLHKVTLDEYPNALCNDGSPAIMYVRAASDPATSDDWVIHMQPGGSCGNYEVCLQRWCGIGSYTADKMSSRFAPPATNGNGLFSRGATNAFGGANQVYIYYCSSDSWVGRRSDAVLEDPTGQNVPFRLHFRGHDILEAAADALAKGVTSDNRTQRLPSLRNAKQVLFSGSSAGSNGLTSTLDWWAKQVPNATRVAGMLDSVYLPLVEDVTDPAIAALYQTGLRAQWTNVRRDLYDAFADESCLDLHKGDDAYLCGLTTHVQLHHLTTPFFSRQDLTDPVTYGYLQAAGATLGQVAVWTRASLERLATVTAMAEEKAAIKANPGSYSSNCGQHIVMLNGPWFGTARMDATVKEAGGADLTVHDALVTWLMGKPIQALDTHPSTVSHCLETTAEQ